MPFQAPTGLAGIGNADPISNAAEGLSPRFEVDAAAAAAGLEGGDGAEDGESVGQLAGDGGVLVQAEDLRAGAEGE